MRVFAGMMMAWLIGLADAGIAIARQDSGALNVGVRICGAETPGCKSPEAKPKRIAGTHSAFVPRAAFATPRYTCGSAAISISEAGYTAIRRIDCKGRTFAYHARKNGKRYRIEVEAGSGVIKSVKPLVRPQRSVA
jgi:hypothetical protein